MLNFMRPGNPYPLSTLKFSKNSITQKYSGKSLISTLFTDHRTDDRWPITVITTNSAFNLTSVEPRFVFMSVGLRSPFSKNYLKLAGSKRMTLIMRDEVIEIIKIEVVNQVELLDSSLNLPNSDGNMMHLTFSPET